LPISGGRFAAGEREQEKEGGKGMEEWRDGKGKEEGKLEEGSLRHWR